MTVTENKCTSFNFISQMLNEIGHKLYRKIHEKGAKINTIFRLSSKYFNRNIMKIF